VSALDATLPRSPEFRGGASTTVTFVVDDECAVLAPTSLVAIQLSARSASM
jgi:hypothetical protein